MKVQYFGDINDYRKFALLKLLAEVGGFRIGVCWLMTEPDQSGQGAKREFIQDPNKWKPYDSVIFDALATVIPPPKLADLRRVEEEGLIPQATFYEAPVSNKKPERSDWHANCLKAFDGVDFAFFDPDNGLEIASRPRGQPNSNKYAFVDELADHFRVGRSILVYQHYPRHISRAEVTVNAALRMVAAMPGATMRSLRTPFAAFLLASRPEHETQVAGCTAEMNRRGWNPRFFDICLMQIYAQR